MSLSLSLCTWSSTDQMHASAPSNVNHSQFSKESMPSPNPSGWKTIHHRIDKGKQAVGVEIAPEIHWMSLTLMECSQQSPFCNTPRHNGCGCRGKRQLEQESCISRSHGQSFSVDKPVPDPEEGIRSIIAAIGKSIAKCPISHTSQNHIHHIFHHDVDLILQWHTSGLEHSKSLKSQRKQSLAWQTLFFD